MKSLIFALVFMVSTAATAATTCVALESSNGEDFDTVLAQVEIAANGEPAVIFQREQEGFLAVDDQQNLTIARLEIADTGAEPRTLVAGNGSQLIYMDLAGNLAILCVRQ